MSAAALFQTPTQLELAWASPSVTLQPAVYSDIMTWRKISESKHLGNHKINLKLLFKKIYQKFLEKLSPIHIFPSVSSPL